MKRFLDLCIFKYILSIGACVLASDRFDTSVSGYVFNTSTGDPLEAVNVYFSQTMFGDATDPNGYFIIRGIPPGMQELVVSIVGYEIKIQPVNIKTGAHLSFTFRLKPKIYQSETIEVVAADQKDWFNDLHNFKRRFLGASPFAESCRIMNESALEFSWPQPGFMKARAKEPLIIINDALGFSMTCILMDFTWEKSNQRWSWAIKPRYDELEPESTDQNEEWEKNRRKAYQGSLHHFLYSLTRRDPSIRDYDLYLSRKTTERVHPLEQFPVRPDLIIAEGMLPDERLLQFDHFLKVVYRREYMPDNTGRFQTSWLHLRQPSVTLDEFGYPREFQPFEVYGYWAILGVADLLPRYYSVD